AGGTREPLDAVRVLTNRSSGRQGHAIAEAAARRGANVTLLTTSPLALDEMDGCFVRRVDVETARELHDEVVARMADADVLVMAAAVADFRPAVAAQGKLRRADGVPDVVLEPTGDVLAAAIARRRDGQVVVGFAAETTDAVERGREKLARKGCDLLVVNDVSKPGVGFDHATNEVVILGDDGSERLVALSSKRAVAEVLLDSVGARVVARGA
ncbi:MAG TPA: phosphopantothenoylcysteine decarboxylase, partial [Acidimicrobiales bacterium]|nr:phosphopantothenoylcysteine decarboxylase [Acidimicrobiales bacterium]